MGIAVLGPLRVDGRSEGLSPRDRVVLSALVVNAHEPTSTETLADALWGDAPPASWSKVVYGCVSRLRKVLGTAAIDRSPTGYLLTVGEDELDHRWFERLLDRGREALLGGDPARASALIDEALGLWRGRALADLEEWEPGRVEAARLEGLRLDAEELRIEAELALGHGPQVLERARALTSRAPFRERRWVLVATAFYQAGRQREALGAVQRARGLLVDELGLDPGPRLVELEQRLLQQDPSLFPEVAAEASGACPYRGLLPYGAADAETFFGREEDVATCLRRLRDTGVLVVVGPSGIGKSSLVLAGVAAALLRDGTSVLVGTPGPHPLDSLAGLRPGGRQTLVVDQAEEAVIICRDPQERDRYLSALVDHVGAGGGLVLTLRADHLSELAANADLARVLEQGLCLLGPLREDDLRRAVEGPARRAGLRLEAGLVDLLLRDVEDQPAGLPMLSHVLRETWQRREGATLTIEGYRATGGIAHAVAQSAEGVYDAMDEAQRARLRSLLLRLVVPSEDGTPVRARVSRDAVVGDQAHRGLVEDLVGARLLSVDDESVQIAHEALVRGWPRLQAWLEDDVEGLRLFRHLTGAAEAWHGMGRPDSELYRGTRLRRAVEWRDRALPDLTDTETAFLGASEALSAADLRAEEETVARERRTNRRLRGSLAGVAVLLVVAVVAGVQAVGSADRARQERVRAERVATVAEAGRASVTGLNHEVLATSLLLQLQALRLDATSGQSWDNLATTLSRPGLPRRVVADPAGTVVAVAVSDSGNLVATSDAETGVRLRDLGTLTPLPFPDRTPSSAVAFSPDGTLLAAAVNQWQPQPSWPRIVDLPVRLHDLPSGRLSDRQLGGWPVGANVEYSLGFSRDGSRIAAGVNRWDATTHTWTTGAVMVWDVAAPEEPVFEVEVPDAPVAGLSPDGHRVYTATAGERPLRVYDVDSGRLLRSATSAAVTSSSAELEVSPDGSTVAVTTRDDVLLLDAETLAPRAPPLREARDGRIAWSHDGSLLLTTSSSGPPVLWETTSWTERRRFESSFTEGGFGPDDETVVAGDSAGLTVWDVVPTSALLTPSRAAAAPPPGGLDLSLPSPDGRTLARAAGGRLWFVDTDTGSASPPVRTMGDARFARWSPDSRWFLAVGPGTLAVWDPRSARLLAERRYDSGVTVVAAFSSDGERVHVHQRDGTLHTLDRATLEASTAPMELADAAGLVADPHDGTVLAVGSDGAVTRVDPERRRVVAGRPAGTVAPEGEKPVALSPDGSLLVAPGADGVVGVLDTRTLEWVDAGSTEPWGLNVAWAPDGSQFASSDGQRVRLWDGRTGAYQAAVPLPAPAGDVTLAYLADGMHLVVASRDGRTWVADVDRDGWMDRACRLAGRNLTAEEWRRYFPGRSPEATCPQWAATG